MEGNKFSAGELNEVLGLFEKDKLDIRDNMDAISRMDVLKYLERSGYITFFHTEENNIPTVALFTDLGIKIISTGGF